MKIDRILVLADDTPCSENAARFGFDLAKGLGADVILLGVIEPIMTTGNTDAGIFPDDALMPLKKKTADFLERIKNKLGAGVHAETLIRDGEILPTVMQVIQSSAIDLVIAGSQARHGISKLLGDNVAESIVRESPLPVCIVPMN